MARLDVYPMPGRRPGLLLDVQSDLLEAFGTRVVVPLLPAETVAYPISGLNPVLDIVGADYVMMTQAIASIPSKELAPPIARVPGSHDDVVRALDLLLIGL